MSVVTRFPPSPTGYLHIGGARTALFSWLYARQQGGQFILRIEDTDRERSTEESVQVILEGMQWLGLSHDTGPFYQSERVERYQEVIQQLLDTDHAYHCYCSKDELDQMREQQRASGIKPRYDGRCRHRLAPEKGVSPVVRFKNPAAGNVVIDDQVKGKIIISNTELDDLIIARSDGMPTYHLTVVVDDMDMGVTHVIRGDDHLNNTPRQMNILKALGAPIPVYAHVPMILGSDGKRMSKRHGAVSVLQYRDDGYLPDALLNYLARLGWSHGDQEIFSREEMTKLFSLDAIHKGAATFDPDKLEWVNYEHMKTIAPEQLLEHAHPYFKAEGIDLNAHDSALAAIVANQQRSRTLLELVERCRFFFETVTEYEAKAVKKHIKGAAGQILKDVMQALSLLPDWQTEPLHQVVHDVAARHEVGLGKVAQPIRIAVSGGAVSPAIDETLFILGKEQTLSRIAQAIDRLF